MFIDLHCHLLPEVDDGSRSVEMSISMARAAVADGTRIIVCTPHINPGLYDYNSSHVTEWVASLREQFAAAEVDIGLLPGGDVHLVADLPARLADGRAPVIGSSRYFLLEFPHDLCPPRPERQVERILAAGFIPVLTHPERYGWIEEKPTLFGSLHSMGCLIQITAGSFLGLFGRRPKFWANQFLEMGQVNVIASDAHDPVNRAPGLTAARDVVAEAVGLEAANQMVLDTPLAILKNAAPETLPKMKRIVKTEPSPKKPEGFFSRRVWGQS